MSRFFDMAPPNTSLVTSIVNNHWFTRGSIRVLRTDNYYIFECQNSRDRDAILRQHTTNIDVKIITFRSSFPNQVPSISTLVWRVQIHNLLWRFLDSEWTVRILSHVGFVGIVEDLGPGLPAEAFLRAKLAIDLSRPLIPNYFRSPGDGQVVWVYFRYEGMFKFCKQCGCCVGHHTSQCLLMTFIIFFIIGLVSLNMEV